VVQTVICAKWGTRYPAAYVNCLWSMIRRNTKRDTRLVCYTDDASGVHPDVVALPMPSFRLPASKAELPWRKVAFWQPQLEGISGDVLFVDLDVVITGSIDAFFDFEPEETFCVIENWTQMGSKIGNTSVYRFRVGAHAYIYESLVADPEGVTSRFPNSQTFISRTARSMVFWPAEWCVSFKHTLIPPWPLNFFKSAPLPPGTKVVCFTGKPDPDEARDGKWPAPWYKKVRKHIRPTPWIAEHWHAD
jgi:hypothetical protein